MPKIFIAGHGRVEPNNNTIQVVPHGVTLHWSVPIFHNSTVGLSRAILSREYSTWQETKHAGEPYLEHYLCPDLSMVMAMKGEAFSSGDWFGSRSYLLQPRLKFTTRLSSILIFLKQKIQEPIDVYWTCCRSPIGKLSRGSVEYKNSIASVVPSDGGVVAAVGPQVINKRIDEGVVTIKRKDSPGLRLSFSWPGAHEADVSQGSNKKNLIATMF